MDLRTKKNSSGDKPFEELPETERKRRFVFALSLAQKAGAVASGDMSVKDALLSGKTKLLLIACDAAPNTKKDLSHYAEKAVVKTLETITTTELGAAIGKGKRSAVAVLNENFAGMLEKLVKK